MTAARPFRSVFFDCDSTLSSLEGIDELARLRPGLFAEVVALTDAAMDGRRSLETVYGERLRLIAPTRAEVEALGARYVETLVPGAREVITALHRLGKTVGVVSGGLRPAVLHVARALGVRDEHVHAVDLHFDAAGNYQTFDEASPLARAGGKRELMATLPSDQRPCAFVGDGSTDLETRGTVDLFVGFGGVVRRAQVQAGADAYVSEPGLHRILDLVLTASEQCGV